MILSSKKDIKDAIIEQISNGTKDTLGIVTSLISQNYTKQGVYKALRTLVVDEIIVKNKTQLSFNPIWLSRLNSFIANLESITHNTFGHEIHSLKEGDNMRFNFRSMDDLQSVWGHYFYNFSVATTGPIVIYSPHNFWYLTDSSIESEMYVWGKKNNRAMYYVSKYYSELDKYTAKDLKEKYNVDSAFDDLKIDDNRHITVFADYIITTTLPTNITRDIQKVYDSHQQYGEDVAQSIKQITIRINNATLKIERNAKKAEKIRKKLLNNFIFYKNVKTTL